MTILYSELKKKDIVDVTNGKNLGKACDLLISKHSGKIEKLIVKRCGFLACEDLEIPFDKIVKIGDDAILIDFTEKNNCFEPKDKCEEKCFCDD